ncbi:hypothetical protein [Arcanobacterium hippocoleae]|uniref:hypothetical protein n=1 Tax=Arcanobacterium hippocoleae TaxID=149017 RepID=UPI003342DE0C
MKLKFDFDPHGCKAIFRKYAAHEAEIRNTVINQITQQIDTGFAKTKLATRLLSHELHVYECRVNIGKLLQSGQLSPSRKNTSR